MASTPTTRNRLNRQDQGDNIDAWGLILNSGVFDLVDEAMDGVTAITVTGHTTLTSVNYATDQARKRVLKLTGSPGATYKVTIPSVEKTYFVHNATNAAQQIGAGGTVASIPANALSFVYCDGVDTYTPSAQVNAAIGSIMNYAGAVAPSGWLMCYGQAVSRTTYSSLFQVLGTTFGAGDGSTTFGIPDLRARIAAGKDDMGGTASGRLGGVSFSSGTPTALGGICGAATKTLTVSEMPAHAHGVTDPGHTHGISDPAHAHGITDPSHVHGVGAGCGAIGAFNNGGGSGLTYYGPSGTSTTAAVTGVSVNAAVTGIAIGGGFTGISTQNNGGGSAFALPQPTIMLNKIIYAGV